ncbi:MAG: efflux transporter outer membrane subunit [Betaproteobacteria bacterium]|nr:efflux transporter outer membrane subunit [Betaproteobacteria bacterium]
MKSRKYLILLIFLFSLGGCKIWPAYERPPADLPAAWRGAPAQGLAIGEHWWTLYNDRALDALLAEAYQHNRDLALAAARVDEARALARVVDAERSISIDGRAQVDRTRSSEVGANPIPADFLERSSHRAQINVSYELDLWGRLRGGSDAARADLLATQAAHDTVRMALAADVVRAYYTLIALDEQIAATQRSLALREDNLRLQRVRNKAGLTSDFQLRQLEAEVAAAQAQLPALQRARTTQEAALAVLLGRGPRAIIEAAVPGGADKNEPPPPVVPEGLPSDLLVRRPDIAQAEQRLIAANARIAAARAAMFPRIALTGYFGSESRQLTDLFSGPALIWQLAAGLAQPIFQGGRLQAEVDAVKAREGQALAQYQKTLQESFREVRQALAAQTRSREVFDAETARVAALRDALRLARIRFESGLSSQLEVIDAERNLLLAELNRIDALRDRRTAVADLVRALGGGWQGLPATAAAQAQ